MEHVETYKDSKVREIGVQGFKTIVEVQPAYRKAYNALRRDIASFAKVTRPLERTKRKSSELIDQQGQLKDSMDRGIGLLLGEYLGKAGVEYKEVKKVDGEEHTSFQFWYNDLYRGCGISISHDKYITAFPDSSWRFTGYNLSLAIAPDKGFQVQARLEEEGIPEIRHVSNALRLLFPKKYNGLGLPAVDYKRPIDIHDKGHMSIAPLSRLPRVKEHIQELGKELSPHLDDLETLLQELREISSRNIIKGSRTMKEVEHTLHREYLHALLEAMGRGI